MTRTSRRRIWGERGATLVEFSLIAPVLVLFIFGVIDYSHLYNQMIDVRSTTREGARLATVNTGGDLNGLLTAMRGRMSDLSSSKAAISVQLQDADGDGVSGEVGENVTVCVRYPRTSVSGFFPWLNGGSMTSRVVMRMEQKATFSSGTTANWPSGVTCP